MCKKIVFFLLAFSNFLYADNYDKYCNDPKTEDIIMICQYSKKAGIDPLIATSAVVFSSVELVAMHCKFSLSEKYFNAALPFLKAPGGKEAKNFFMNMYLDNNLPPPGYTGNDKSFCKFNYDLMGPLSNENFYN